jgi:hypothetical protein
MSGPNEEKSSVRVNNQKYDRWNEGDMGNSSYLIFSQTRPIHIRLIQIRHGNSLLSLRQALLTLGCPPKLATSQVVNLVESIRPITFAQAIANRCCELADALATVLYP